MRTRAEAIAACLRLSGVYEDYPFDDPNWTVMRHAGNKKSFAYIYERNGNIWINLKAEPLRADFWRDAYASVVPAYHMNKENWISILLDGTVSADEIKPLLELRYQLTR